ncbi:hypothetical protein ABBQ32_013528 [Trebouxia sp. C0010 RCD-2024]
MQTDPCTHRGPDSTWLMHPSWNEGCCLHRDKQESCTYIYCQSITKPEVQVERAVGPIQQKHSESTVIMVEMTLQHQKANTCMMRTADVLRHITTMHPEQPVNYDDTL